MLIREIRWRNPFELIDLPPLARLYVRAHLRGGGMGRKLSRHGYKALLGLAHRAGAGGEGSFRLNVKGTPRPMRFRARNLQFHAIYLPQHCHGAEPETAALLDVLVGPNDCFYDVGANWGYYALYIASRDDFAGHVHAFEPMPGTFEDLVSMVQQARLGTLITPHQLGASDTARSAHMMLPDGLHSGSASVTSGQGGGGGVGIELKALDHLGLPNPAVIKMDVEGHELQAIMGARRILTEHHPMLVFENWPHPDKPEETLAPLELLESFGYSFFRPCFDLQTPGGSRFALDSTEGFVFAPDQLKRLALFEFKPRERFLVGTLFNVLACHSSQRGKLESLFTPADARAGSL